MTRLRVLKLIVQPVCLADDGETLSEVPVAPVEVPYARWADFDLEAALGPLRAQAGDDT